LINGIRKNLADIKPCAISRVVRMAQWLRGCLRYTYHDLRLDVGLPYACVWPPSRDAV